MDNKIRPFSESINLNLHQSDISPLALRKGAISTIHVKMKEGETLLDALERMGKVFNNQDLLKRIADQKQLWKDRRAGKAQYPPAEKDYFEPGDPLYSIIRRIEKHGEFYHKDVGWY